MLAVELENALSLGISKIEETSPAMIKFLKKNKSETKMPSPLLEISPINNDESPCEGGNSIR